MIRVLHTGAEALNLFNVGVRTLDFGLQRRSLALCQVVGGRLVVQVWKHKNIIIFSLVTVNMGLKPPGIVHKAELSLLGQGTTTSPLFLTTNINSAFRSKDGRHLMGSKLIVSY